MCYSKKKKNPIVHCKGEKKKKICNATILFRLYKAQEPFEIESYRVRVIILRTVIIPSRMQDVSGREGIDFRIVFLVPSKQETG